MGEKNPEARENYSKEQKVSNANYYQVKYRKENCCQVKYRKEKHCLLNAAANIGYLKILASVEAWKSKPDYNMFREIKQGTLNIVSRFFQGLLSMKARNWAIAGRKSIKGMFICLYKTNKNENYDWKLKISSKRNFEPNLMEKKMTLKKKMWQICTLKKAGRHRNWCPNEEVGVLQEQEYILNSKEGTIPQDRCITVSGCGMGWVLDSRMFSWKSYWLN